VQHAFLKFARQGFEQRGGSFAERWRRDSSSNSSSRASISWAKSLRCPPCV
jgi:hypothetical protein